MRDVFKYARHIRPGDVVSGQEVKSVHTVLMFSGALSTSLPGDEVVLVETPHPTGSMLTHLSHAELEPLPGSQAAEALERLNRLRALVEAAAGWNA
jgi:hypothetical protein